MTALGLLCEIIAAGGKSAASAFRNRPGYAPLVRQGFLQLAGVVSSVVCDECETPHSAQVVFVRGDYGYYCPDLGYVALDQANIQAMRPDMGQLVGTLAEALVCKRRKQTPVHGQTWRVGALEVDAGEIMLYLHPKLQSEEDARELSDALSREVRAQWRLVITAAGTLPVPGAQAVRLGDLAELEEESGYLRILAEPADFLGMPRRNPGGRPSAYGDLLKPLIEKRIQTGKAVEAVNAEFREVRSLFQAAYPNHPLPSESAIKRYIREARRGS